MAKPFRLLDLPADILVLVFPYLEPEEFYRFCKINRACWRTWHFEPEYWRTLTRRTFRVPDNPLLHADGERWYWLYKKMRTDTNAFTWGQNAHSCLGQGHPAGLRPNPRQPRLPGRPRYSGGAHIPKQMEVPKEVGIIADLQCGGWSTTLLNSDGVLFSVGMMDAADGVMFGQRALELTRLSFPPGYPETTSSRTDPSTAIDSFSAGRRHVLALSDDGKLWSWNEIPGPGSRLEFRNIVPHGPIIRAVAGWAQSSAYVQGTGIVHWPTVGETHPEVRGPADDGASVDVRIVPNTAYLTPQNPARDGELEAPGNIGEIVKHVCLEGWIVFFTTLNTVFAYSFSNETVWEIFTFSAPGRELSDIQGSFRRFAVFTKAGEVLIAETSILERFTYNQSAIGTDPRYMPEATPVLQNNNVISLAFGDYHMHALHSTGQISSYGTDPQCMGALGLGNAKGSGKWRGLTVRLGGADIIHRPGRTLPHYIWFEPEKQVWLDHLEETARRPTGTADEADRSDGEPQPEHRPLDYGTPQQILRDQGGMESFTEWVEQEGQAWADYPDIKAQDPDGLGAYFALNVAAAGWHSGALVLVNKGLAEQISEKHVARRTAMNKGVDWRWDGTPFPRIKLHGGFELPGDGPLHAWKYGMPES